MNSLSFLDFLVEPTFIDRSNPPLRVSATTIGWIAVVLAALGLLGLLIAIPVVFAVGTAVALAGGTTGSHSGIFLLALLGLVLTAITTLIALVGGWQMTQGNHNGRRLLIQALALNLIFSLIYNIGVANVGNFIFQLIVDGIIYYFVVISRFPDEVPMGAGPTPGRPLSS